MTNEIIDKITRIATREISARGRTLPLSPPSEAEVQHLFTLSRKLIERVPKVERSQYALLKLYCDWTLHSGIDQSKEGAKILSHIHETLIKHLNKTDNQEFSTELSAALSLDTARLEMNVLISRHGGSIETFSQATWNSEIVPVLAEIISHTPLKIGSFPWLTAILEAIKLKPLKGTSVVEELAVIKMPSQLYNDKASENEMTFCLMITTTDTTRIIAPLINSSKSGIPS